MIGLLCLLFLLLVIFYLGLSLRRGSVVFLLAWLLAGTVCKAFVHPLSLLLLLAVLAVLNVPSVRLKVLSAPIKKLLAGMMPTLGSTEKEALDAGTTWWEKDIFSGRPDWDKFDAINLPTLSPEEQSFIDNEVEELCAMVNEWDIHHRHKDLPPEVWQFIKEKGFLGLIIPEEFGGKHFSPYAQSRAVGKIASRSTVAAVTVMVPNSLGPGELLVKYGTPEQQQYWLPRLARGEEIPCFGLTSPEAGSDAGAIPDVGVVCKQMYEGEETLGVRLSFSKRWITLAPVATVVGLAFKLRDPEHLIGDTVERGITCALVPANQPGMEIGRRHNPGSPFMNGPMTGVDVFVPMSMLIGGQERVGQGWRMLVECLGAGRGVSLPALSTAGGEMSYLMVGAFARIRRQFGISVGKFEGVQEATAEIASSGYTLEAYRAFVTRGLQDGAPSVLTAMAKYHATEMMREVVNDSMDVLGGRGIQMGPRNFMALVYQSIPIAITVEGANILTRSMIIFGQGAIRCHPYLAEELVVIQQDGEEALQRFDSLLMGHLGHAIGVISRAIAKGVTAGWLDAPKRETAFAKRWYRYLDRYSAALAASADIALATLGGDLKRKELLSARLGDVHSQLVIACALLKFQESLPDTESNRLHAEYSLRRCFKVLNISLNAFYDNVPVPGLGSVMRRLFFPWGTPVPTLRDSQIRRLGRLIMEPSEVREVLSKAVYLSKDPEDATGRINVTYAELLEVEEDYDKFLRAEAKGKLTGKTVNDRIDNAAEQGIFSAEVAEKVKAYETRRYDCLLTDAFDPTLEKVDIRIARP
ncbi:acyl-CoA dehydrogenase [Spongiibacter taiwanensis]|uniref:acyl-CoA dehydrogenase n=1 Tax=Spongiibacter taiwanensis TaxID=1748242 RepID=UPI00203609F8|nr:acyl-CoA dehydrogenase [Spongiibacter taiwanensis]USA41929.1 acyl-CoA dehydrogenase [Spongiibacter taiwanensis]